MTIVPHPSYSLELVPCDFLSSKIISELKRQRFDTVDETQNQSEQVLDAWRENNFQKAFGVWQHHLDHCTNADGNYFEGDGSHT